MRCINKIQPKLQMKYINHWIDFIDMLLYLTVIHMVKLGKYQLKNNLKIKFYV